jgi:hypothetical protein
MDEQVTGRCWPKGGARGRPWRAKLLLMSTQSQDRCARRIRRGGFAGIVAALAIAAPSGEANAATPGTVGPYIPRVAFAYGGLAMGDVFNGGTTVVVSTAPALANTVGSP